MGAIQGQRNNVSALFFTASFIIIENVWQYKAEKDREFFFPVMIASCHH